MTDIAKLAAITSSLEHWEENLLYAIDGNNTDLNLNGNDCALCAEYRIADPDDRPYNNHSCEYCPLYKLGDGCTSPTSTYRQVQDALAEATREDCTSQTLIAACQRMIAAIEKCLTLELEKTP